MDTNEIREYQTIAACLLKKHFGLTLNDTNLHDDAVVLALIKRGVPAFEAINQLVEKYHLDRTECLVTAKPIIEPEPFPGGCIRHCAGEDPARLYQ